MWWFLLGLGVGILAGRETASLGVVTPGAAAAGAQTNNLFRVADDLINTTDTLRPVLFRIRDAARDGRITLQDWIGLYAEVDRI
jgi:hypothetical protein